MAATFCAGPAASAAANPSSAGCRRQSLARAGVLPACWRPTRPTPAFLSLRRPNAELRPLRVAAGSGVDPKVRYFKPTFAVCGDMGWVRVLEGAISSRRISPLWGTCMLEEQSREALFLETFENFFVLVQDSRMYRCVLFFNSLFHD
jgi:hypothetical protein